MGISALHWALYNLSLLMAAAFFVFYIIPRRERKNGQEGAGHLEACWPIAHLNASDLQSISVPLLFPHCTNLEPNASAFSLLKWVLAAVATYRPGQQGVPSK